MVHVKVLVCAFIFNLTYINYYYYYDVHQVVLKR